MMAIIYEEENEVEWENGEYDYVRIVGTIRLFEMTIITY